ncbi:TPM domain-containing protein [candidate division WOR-3 bacterium]|nr:TPM domain-containing protein [candidate division WOR-3 bacterium]
MKLVAFLSLTTSLLSAEYPPPPDIYNYSYVQDQAEVIDDYHELLINDLCWEVDKMTTAQMAVLTVSTTGGQDISLYATEVANEWGVGQEEGDNGLLLVTAIQDRQYFTATGYGMEGIIPDAKAARIQRQELVPYFKSGNYGEGIFRTFQLYAKEIQASYDVEFEGTKNAPKLKKNLNIGGCIGWFFPIIFAIIAFIFSIIRRGGKGTGTGFWVGGGGFSSGGGGGFSGGGSFGGGSFGGGGAGGGW